MTRCIALYFWLLPLVAHGALAWEQTTVHADVPLDRIDATFEFRFTNTGDVPLRIKDVRSSCGCVAVDFVRQSYAPREKGTIKVVVHTGASGQDAVLKTSVLVVTDEPGDNATILTAVAKLPKLVAFDPPILRWRIGEPVHAMRIQARIVTSQPVRLLSVKADEALLSAKLIPVEEGRLYELVVEPKSTHDSWALTLVVGTDLAMDKGFRRVSVHATCQNSAQSHGEQ